MNPLYFRRHSDIEIDKDIDNSNIVNNTINIYKQNPVCNDYFIVSELNPDVLRIGFYEFNLDYDNIDCFVYEVIKLENKKAFYFKNTNKDIKKSEKDEEY